MLMFSLLLIISSCKNEYKDPSKASLICRNKPTFLLYTAIAVIFFVGMKFVLNRKEKNLKKKNN